ncbi:hypothetical protein F4808DRAFT_463333 [Astrocystis sublimbata]|nr:hypothetical protein F4808DRAFT_463333 [Astrocystis sublimbata]
MIFHRYGMVLRLGCRTYSALSVALKVCIGLMVIDAIIELAFVSISMRWMRSKAGPLFWHFMASGSKHRLSALPRHLITEHLHTMNAAAGTAFVHIGLMGFMALVLRDWAQYRPGKHAKYCRRFYYFWLVSHLPALLLTFATMIYVFAITIGRASEKIDVQAAVKLDGKPYDLNRWTPDGWLTAVLEMNVIKGSEEIEAQLKFMKTWLWNLPTVFLLQSGVTMLALLDYNRWVIKPRLQDGAY